MIKIPLLPTDTPHSVAKRQKYRDMRGRHPSVIDVLKFKTDVSKETLRVGV